VWHGIPSGYGFMVFTPPGKLSLTWKPPQIASSNQTFIFYPFCWSSMFVWQIIIRIWSLLATCPHTRVLTHADLELQRLWTKDKVSHAALSLKKIGKSQPSFLDFFISWYQLISDAFCSPLLLSGWWQKRIRKKNQLSQPIISMVETEYMFEPPTNIFWSDIPHT
jgi:hypothetical protein